MSRAVQFALALLLMQVPLLIPWLGDSEAANPFADDDLIVLPADAESIVLAANSGFLVVEKDGLVQVWDDTLLGFTANTFQLNLTNLIVAANYNPTTNQLIVGDDQGGRSSGGPQRWGKSDITFCSGSP